MPVGKSATGTRLEILFLPASSKLSVPARLLAPAYASLMLRRGKTARHHPSFCWRRTSSRLAEPKLSFAERRLVEVARVELASEMESAKLLRVYPAIGLGRGTPTSGLIPFHPLGSAPCSGRTEPPAACPARLCRGGSAGVGRATCGNYLGRESVIAVRNYLFSRFLTRPTRILDARSDLNSSRRNRITPSWLVHVLYHKFRCRAPSAPRPTPR